MKGLGAFALFIMIAVGLLLISQGGLFSGLPTGFTTLSLSQAQFQSSNQFFNQKLWVMTVAQGGLGQSATGTFTKQDIASKSGTQPETDFKMTINYNEQSCNYAIVRDTNAVPIKTYVKQEWGWCLGVPSAQDAIAHCPNAEYAGKYSGELTCWCLDALKQTGDISQTTIQNPIVRTKSTITVTGKNGITDSVNIDTAGNSQGFFNGNNAYYIWNGDLFKQNCPSQAAYFAFYKNAGWRIGSSTSYTNYVNSHNNLVAISQAGGVPTRTQIESAINNNNYNANNAMLGMSFAETIEGQGQLDGAVIKKTVATPVTSPLYTFYVKADFLGIYQPQPSIFIESASCSPFNTYGTISATLKNLGESGNANVWVECDSPFSFSGNNQNIYVAMNGVQGVTLPITANVGVSTTKTCTVKSNDGFTTSIKPVSCTANPSQVCTAGKSQCTPEQTIVKCNDAGSGWELLKACDKQTEECKYNIATGIPNCEKLDDYCITHPADAQCVGECQPIFGILPDIICLIGQWWATYGAVLIIILALIGFIIFMLVAK